MQAMKKYADDFASGGKYHDRAENSDNDNGNDKLGEQTIGASIKEYLSISSYDDPIHSLDCTRDRYNVSSSADLT